MKTFQEQVADLKATREAHTKKMREIAQKSVDEGRSMDTAEAEQFDTLESEIKRMDSDIARLSRLAEMDKSSAKPVDDEDQRSAPAAGGSKVPISVKNTQKLEPGIAFARLARVKALSHTDQLGTKDQVQIAKMVYPGDEKLISSLVNKAPVSAANTLSPTWAGNLINEGGIAFADFVEYLRPMSLLGRISDRLRRLPFDTPVLIQSSGGSASWTKEGEAKPVTSWGYTRTKLTPLKVTAIAAATQETLMRASAAADALLRDELARAISATIDMTFMSDIAAVTDESPAGILAGTAPLTLSSGTDSDAVRSDVSSFLNAYVNASLSLAGAFWVMPERMAIALSLMQNPLGQSAFPGVNFEGGTFFGLPVYVTSYADTDSNGSAIALIKGDEIFLGDEGGIQVSMSDQASLLMDSAPTMNSTTPTPAQLVSLWQTNSVGFRVERYLNFSKRRAQAVAWGRVNWDAGEA